MEESTQKHLLMVSTSVMKLLHEKDRQIREQQQQIMEQQQQIDTLQIKVRCLENFYIVKLTMR